LHDLGFKECECYNDDQDCREKVKGTVIGTIFFFMRKGLHFFRWCAVKTCIYYIIIHNLFSLVLQCTALSLCLITIRLDEGWFGCKKNEKRLTFTPHFDNPLF
jgi:hypothetical protein